MPHRVVIASCHPLPAFDAEHQPLIDALAVHGVQTEVVPWDQRGYDWSSARLVIIRSTWDYHQRLEEFLAWAEVVSKASRLWNPFEAIRWNSHKRYLEELREQGVSTIPTLWLNRGETHDLSPFFEDAKWEHAVAKPAVSVGAQNTMRFARDERLRAEDHIKRVSQSCDVMLQPYLKSVETYGERSLVYLGGTFSHAVLRPAMLAEKPPQTSMDLIKPVPATREERQTAQLVLSKVRWPWLYARVDLLPGPDERPMLMELELIEPSLFLRHGPSAAERLAEEIKKRL